MLMLVKGSPRLLAVAALLVATWLTYRPGLSGSFVFDDFANLPALGESGPIRDIEAAARYLTSGKADPFGRPIALASFLLDANDWPAKPWPFKATNVIVHLLNGLLLFAVLDKLGRRAIPRASPARVSLGAWIGCALWLLHPFLVSTTLYIVQREAMLPATFTLLGILAWLGADAGYRRESTRTVLGFGFVAVLCLLFALLSKANGLLLPTLILVIDSTLLAHQRAGASNAAKRAFGLLRAGLWISTIVILAWLVRTAIVNVIGGLSHRPWTEGQRLLTEPRILWEYLAQLWLPHPFTAGLFNDTVNVSTGLLHPFTTLPAILGVMALIAGALACRRRSPFVSCAILFFFAGHLLESTSVPLELYFEHRNYLPSMLLFWPLGLWFAGVNPSQSDGGHPFPSHAIRYGLAAVVVASLTAMTHANAALWGDSANQASIWARFNPDSARAQAGAAQEDIQHGRPERAVARLAPMLRKHPAEVQIAFNLIAARCAMNQLTPADMAVARDAIATAVDPGSLISTWFERSITVANQHGCPGFDLDSLTELAQAGLTNPKLPAGRLQDLEHVLGMIALEDRRPDDALLHFNRSLAFDVRETVALRQAAELGSAGFPRLGLQHLTVFDALPIKAQTDGPGMQTLHRWVLKRQDYWPRERRRLEATLRADIKASP